MGCAGKTRTTSWFWRITAAGKTHFLCSFGARALDEGFAVSYVPCSAGLSLDEPLAVYKELVKNLQQPGEGFRGLQALLEAVIRTKREEIERAGAPDVDGALRRWRLSLRREGFPENAFGRVMAAALEAVEGEGTTVGEAAFHWLQGEPEILNRGTCRSCGSPGCGRRIEGRSGGISCCLWSSSCRAGRCARTRAVAGRSGNPDPGPRQGAAADTRCDARVSRFASRHSRRRSPVRRLRGDAGCARAETTWAVTQPWNSRLAVREAPRSRRVTTSPCSCRSTRLHRKRCC